MEPFLGGIYIVGFNFAPQGYAFCNGQFLSINQNTALFSLLGTTYGGNGIQTFQLPNLQGRVPVHQGNGVGLSTAVMGQTGGVQSVTLTTSNLPAHSHTLNVNNSAGTTGVPATNTVLSEGPVSGSGPDQVVGKIYTTNGPNVALSPVSIGNTGAGTPVQILNPYLVVNYIIALVGIFPARS